MTKRRWIGGIAAAVAVVVTASAAFACDQHAEAAAVKDSKAVVVNANQKDCDMPCCAHAKNAVAAKADAPKAGDTPCAAHAAKGCAKKASTAVAQVEPAKVEPAKEAVKAEPAVDPGTNR